MILQGWCRNKKKQKTALLQRKQNCETAALFSKKRIGVIQ